MNAVPLFATVARALIILSIAAGLQYSSWHLPIMLPSQWPSWVAANVLLLFFAPLLLGYVMLSDAPSEFGMRIGDWKLGLKWAMGLFVASLPLAVVASRLPAVQQFYRMRYLPSTNSGTEMMTLALTTMLYMVAWEFFFRGFVLFGLKPALGGWAVILQAVMFMVGHLGKPGLEVAGSLIAGLVLGAACWRTGAFWPAAVTHGLFHATFNVLVLR